MEIGKPDSASVMEAGLRSGNCAVLTGGDSKKFRVRVLASENEIYQKYFRKDLAKKISKAQIIMGLVITISQIGTMCLRRYSSSLESTGMGIWASFVAFVAAAFVLWTCKKITYMRLHLSMATQILSVIGHIFLLMSSLGESIPSLRYRLYESYSTHDDYKSNYYYNNNYYNNGVNDGIYNSSMDYYHRYSPPRYNNYYGSRSSEHDPVGILVVSFILTTVMSVLGLIQLILSIILSIMTIRSMCSGRTNMEGKMFAMEITGREDSIVSMIIPQKHSCIENGKGSMSQSNSHTGTLPPPYDKILLGHSDAASIA